MSVGITLTLLFLAEMVLVAAGLAYYFYRQWQRGSDVDLEAEITKAKQEAVEEAERNNFNIALALQFLLDETRRYLQLDDNNIVKNSELTEEQGELLKLRIEYLQAECKSLEGQGRDTTTHWGHLYEYLTPLFPQPPLHAEGESNPGLWQDAQALCGVIKQQLSDYMDKIDSLVKRLSEGGEIDEETLAELQVANQFRDNLILQLSSLSALAGANLDENDTEGAETVSEMDKLKNMLDGQKSAMDGLMNSLGDDDMKESLPEIEAKLAEIERASRELKMCVDVLKMDEPAENKTKVAPAAAVAATATAAVAVAAVVADEVVNEPPAPQETASAVEEPPLPDDEMAEDVLFAEIDIDATIAESTAEKPAPDNSDASNDDFDDLVLDLDPNDEDQASTVPTLDPSEEVAAADIDIDELLAENSTSEESTAAADDSENQQDGENTYINDAELDAILDEAIEDIDIK